LTIAAAGTPCAVHGERDAVFVCVRCGNFACADCAFSPLGDKTICAACASRGLPEPIPWERRRELGFWRALHRTTRAVCFSPTRFFRTPFVAPDMSGSLYYGAAIYTLGQALYAATIALALLAGGIGLGIAEDEPIFAGVGVGYGLCLFVSIAVQAPIYGLLGVLVSGALSHGTLALLKSANASFDASIRVVAYANGAQVFFAVPCVGLLAPMWVIWLETIGLREVHGISTAKALVATLGYRFLLLGLFVGAYALVLAFAFLSARR
jgi:hypothetical protein